MDAAPVRRQFLSLAGPPRLIAVRSAWYSCNRAKAIRSQFQARRYSIHAVLGTFLVWLESTGFSVWMRESPSVFSFPMILAAHTIGLGLLAGIDVAHGLRVLGVAPRIPYSAFNRFLPLMWVGLGTNVASGVALLIGYPTKALTNPVFYLKLSLIGVALVLVKFIRRDPQHRSARLLAGVSLLCWAGAIVTGRLLAYTYSYLDVADLLEGRGRP